MALNLDSIDGLQSRFSAEGDVVANQPRDSVPRTILHRAASFDSTKEEDVGDGSVSPGMKRTFSDASLSAKNETPPVKENFAAGKDILRRVTLRPSNKSKSSRRQSTSRTLSKNTDTAIFTDDATLKETSGNHGASENTQNPRRDFAASEAAMSPHVKSSKGRTVSGKIATFARVSWMSTSQSPSSARSELNTEAPQSQQHPTTSKSQPLSTLSTNGGPLNTDNKADKELITDANDDTDTRKNASGRKYRRPLSAFVTRSKSTEPPLSLLRGRKSMDQLVQTDAPKPEVPPMPKPPATFTLAAAEPVRKKDELWFVFRNLEADLQKFQSKSTNLKANVVRSSLLPFFARYASHPSFNYLRPEDLDRRVNILNKWWTALLALINGKHNQSISGTDRPVYLEALSGIMMRKEWRIPYNPQQFTANSSNSSLESGSSDFLAESIYHNVRNIFNQNLLSQMSFVVERMSLRHAPASLVIFCGTACAYAFFFCPGVADMLVRLWNTPADAFRRLLADPSVYRGASGRAITQDIAARFPLPVRPLAFSSPVAISRYLRQPPTLPLSAVQIPWHGPWMSRWCGRDSDLFYVFVKYFHMLSCEFLPRETETSYHIFAPGMLSVQSHLLIVMEDTLYRQSSPQLPENAFGASAVTFDDFIEGPNAAMSTLPIGIANCHRSMSENRLITLLRDFLLEPSAELDQARRMYVESFMRVLKTAARKTSLFNQNACFVLCDFVQEAAPMVNRYGRKIKEDLFEWAFWMDVCKKLTRSQNSMTEVRLFAFLFSMWKPWTSNSSRHHDLCTQFLLHDDYFYTYFSHWNPMVRAYFHRLLCWRVARFKADPTPADSEIFEMLLDKLEQIWAYYLTYNFKARNESRPLLSSELCSPAPGRRILIIRSDNQSESPRNPFVSFDRLTSPGSTLNASGFHDHGTLKLDPNGVALDTRDAPKRRWNLLKIVFGGTTNPKPGEVTPPGSVSDESETNPIDSLMGDEDNSSNGTSTPPNDSNSQTGDDVQDVDDTDSLREAERSQQQPYNFKFSLEGHAWNNSTKTRPLYTPSLPRRTLLYVQHQRSVKALTSKAPTEEFPPSVIEEHGSRFESTRDTDTSTASTTNSYATTKTSSVDESDFDDGDASRLLRNERIVASKYAGRALAEWAQVVCEYDNFFDRRRNEGVPSDELVETPSLSVENFRK